MTREEIEQRSSSQVCHDRQIVEKLYRLSRELEKMEGLEKQ